MKARSIVFIVVISIFLWGISLYNGWLYEAFLFGYNISTGWFEKDTPGISTNKDKTTVRYGEFTYRLLTDIAIPDNITAIEKGAFRGNKLTSVIIGSNVSLGENAIGSGFEHMYIGNGKRAGTYTRTSFKSTEWIIWYDNFACKSNYESVTIIDYIGTDDAVVIPAEIFETPVTIIKSGAFRGKNLTSVTIPNTVKHIEENAFRRNQLTRITIPNSVGIIELNAFDENQITRVSIGANVLLGDDGAKGVQGILGSNTGFNSAYSNNNRREGVYTRPDTRRTSWTRVPR